MDYLVELVNGEHCVCAVPGIAAVLESALLLLLRLRGMSHLVGKRSLFRGLQHSGVLL